MKLSTWQTAALLKVVEIQWQYTVKWYQYYYVTSPFLHYYQLIYNTLTELSCAQHYIYNKIISKQKINQQ